MTTARLQGIARYLPSLAAGALTPLAFAPVNLPALAIAMPALLVVAWLGATPRSAFAHGYLFGLGLFGAGVNWLHISINQFGGVGFAGAVALTFLFVAFVALYPAVTGWLARRLFAGNSEAVFLFAVVPALWVLVEWLRGWLFTGFPWLNLGYSQIDTPLAGLAPVAGVYAVSWAVMFSACLLVGLVRGPRRARVTALALLALLWGTAWWSGQQVWTEAEHETVDVALVQGSVPQSLKWDPAVRDASMELYLNLTRPYLGDDLIIWPETAIPAFHYQVTGFLDRLGRLARRHGSRLLVGIPVRDADSGAYYNSIMALERPPVRYDKRHLVPFGEYLPFRSMLGGLLRFLQIPMSDFSAGTAARPLMRVDGLRIGASICYEDAFGEEVIQALPEANLLVNVSNDAWFGDSFAPHQHLQMARMRALESGRYMLRATNNGVSAIIDAHGRIRATTAQFQAAVLSGEARLLTGSTPYAVTGNAAVVIAAALLLLAAALGGYRSGARRSA